MMMLDLELEAAKEAAIEAGKEILSYHKGELDIREKGTNDYVTAADLKANEAIRNRLRREFPEDGWLSEESSDTAERVKLSRVWIVDPLDGTNEFIAGSEEFAVSIALVENKLPVLGIIYNPARDQLYFALKGKGAYLNESKISCSPGDLIANARLVISRAEYKINNFRSAVDLLPNKDFRTVGSNTMKMVEVAAGRADFYFSLEPKSEWDCCAGELIVSEAGGRVTDLAGKKFSYNNRNVKIESILVSNGRLHQKLIELFQL